MSELALLEKQLNGDLALLRHKLQVVEEEVQAIRTLITRIELTMKFHLET